MPTELETKQKRLADFLERHGLDGVLLTRRDNFSWITCGRDNHIANNTPGGVATIYATRDGARTCLASVIEAPRFRGEELVGTGIETVDFPWHDTDTARKVVGEIVGGKKVATDSNDFGLKLPHLPGEFDELRWQLTPAEVERYRDGARRAAAALERACRDLRPNNTEHEAAGILDLHIHKAGLNPLVTLVAADERIRNYRHPIPTDHSIREQIMLITCAEFGGLISCLTRIVRFTKMPAELKTRHEKVCNVDAAVNHATRPGRLLGEIFADLEKAYAHEGFDGEWKLHHQGGSCGYNPRDRIGTPGNRTKVLDSQAYAWNPSITGTKSEDTVLVTAAGGVEVLTAHSAEWPSVTGRDAGGHELRRADVLVHS
jgi:Xaa-Pro aminopeptidase